MKIAISPDENPGDSGSVAADGTTERSVNLLVASALQQALQRCGQDVWFDPSLTFEQRAALASSNGTELLVACAHNESTPGRRGTQFVFCPGGEAFGKQAAAADAVYAELAKIPGWPARIGNADEAIVEGCDFAGDTVYIEFLFMSPEDERIWSQPGYPQAAAEATARGLAATYGFAYVPAGVAPAPPIFVPFTATILAQDGAGNPPHWFDRPDGADQGPAPVGAKVKVVQAAFDGVNGWVQVENAQGQGGWWLLGSAVKRDPEPMPVPVPVPTPPTPTPPPAPAPQPDLKAAGEALDEAEKAIKTARTALGL